MYDALVCGRRVRIFHVLDDFFYQSMHTAVATAINSALSVRALEQITRDHSLPRIIRTNNGPKFFAEAFKQ